MVARGILAVLDVDEESLLPHFEYDVELLEESSKAMILGKTARFTNKHCHDASNSSTAFDDSCGEFTLFFLADSTNRNSVRVRSVVVDFVQRTSEECSCLYIANREADEDRFALGTGFQVISWEHPRRSALLQMLVVSRVPSVVVVETRTGRRITDMGMEAIELAMSNNDPKAALKAWRKRQSGISCAQRLQSTCVVL